MRLNIFDAKSRTRGFTGQFSRGILKLHGRPCGCTLQGNAMRFEKRRQNSKHYISSCSLWGLGPGYSIALVLVGDAVDCLRTPRLSIPLRLSFL